MEKKTRGLVIIQLAVLFIFLLAVIGSTPESRAVGQGAFCGGNGYTLIGYYNTKSECRSACSSNGYSSWCSGENTTACFCK